MNIEIRFGQTIRALRQQKGLTQEKLGELAGLNQSYVGDIERGERNPSLRTINNLCRALGLSVSETFNLMEQPQSIQETPLPYLQEASEDDAAFLNELIQELLLWKNQKC